MYTIPIYLQLAPGNLGPTGALARELVGWTHVNREFRDVVLLHLGRIARALLEEMSKIELSSSPVTKMFALVIIKEK